jgi:hypothetical protein
VAASTLRRGKGADHFLGHLALLVARVEHLRAVDGADEVFTEVSPVDLEEVLEQLRVGEPLRVEDDSRALRSRRCRSSSHPFLGALLKTIPEGPEYGRQVRHPVAGGDLPIDPAHPESD